ncbi:hypothetical protein GCM10022267_70880 [Lentzea roselyniae]|uniref:peptide-methionine (S)-S-oxide reductase n=1 Tax=Lentzea roselyniae TaxID=531940 RepID=A0ABP7C0A2_9PSEU
MNTGSVPGLGVGILLPDPRPSTRNRQGNDIGASYRSAIFYTDDAQKQVAEATIADVDASGSGRARSSPR